MHIYKPETFKIHLHSGEYILHQAIDFSGTSFQIY